MVTTVEEAVHLSDNGVDIIVASYGLPSCEASIFDTMNSFFILNFISCNQNYNLLGVL